MRSLGATLVVGITLCVAAYLGSLRLGSVQYWFSGSHCRHMAPQTACGGLVPAEVQPTHHRAVWQIPVTILIGAFGVAVGLVVLRTRPRQPLGNSQAA